MSEELLNLDAIVDRPEPTTIKQAEAARRFGVSDRTLRRWDKLGLIKGKRVRGAKLYPVAKLKKLVGAE